MTADLLSFTVPDEVVMNRIYLFRSHKVMLDSDLAKLYEVETKQLKRQVNRNKERFPEDFMFQLTREEYQALRCQTGTLEPGAHTKYLPYVFTEHGVLMLSSVLSSPRAIQVNIQIMRIFARIRQMLTDNTELRLEVEQIKKKIASQSQNIELVFKYLDELLEKQDKPVKSRPSIGFRTSRTK
jgi:hypothetical protein